jgi:hypothetical protein
MPFIFGCATDRNNVSETNFVLIYNVQVSEPLEGSQMRRIYSAYPGTGSVYTVIAKHGTATAAYVPSLTYACSTVYWTDTCDVLSESLHLYAVMDNIL